jgi:TetR/AcrR family transcriptional regulator
VPKVVDRDEQRARIRGAARAVFARRGLSRTGLAHVASAAGISRPTLYHYFADKQALVRDLAAELLEEEERLFAQALAAPGPLVPRLERLADAVVDRFGAWAKHGGALLEAWAEDPRGVRALLRRVRSDLASMIGAAQRAKEIVPGARPEDLALMIIGLIDGLMLQVFLDPKGVPPTRATKRALRDVLVRVLRGEETR